MQDFKKETPACADPIYRSPPTPTEIPTQVTSRKILEPDIDALEQDITLILKKILHIKKV